MHSWWGSYHKQSDHVAFMSNSKRKNEEWVSFVETFEDFCGDSLVVECMEKKDRSHWLWMSSQPRKKWMWNHQEIKK